MANPAAAMAATDELYLIRSPFGITDDFAITWANMLASIAAQATGTWGISISGNAATATSATNSTNSVNVGTTANSTNASFFPLFVASNAGGNQAAQLGTGLSFNPSTNTLSTTTFVGALTGNASTATLATNATNVGTTAVSTNATFYPLFVSSVAGGNFPCDVNSALNYNPSTGNLSATTFTGSFSGTVTNATNVATTQVSNNASYFPLFVASSTNGNQPCDLGTGITFNPSTNTLTTTTFSGALSGNATTATTATTATNATNVATTQVSTNASFFPLFVASSTNGNQACDLGTGITFNPSTNTLSTTTFSGALSGNATTATTATTANALASAAIWVTTVNQASGSATLAVNTQYITNNGASLVTYTLPATAAQGSIFRVIGHSAGGWKINVASGQTLHLGSSATTTSTGSIASTNQWDCVEVVCTVANTTFACMPPQGSLTVA